MTHNYNAKINYYSFLLGKPKAWELLFPGSTVITKNDIINVIEVDNAGVPTGNTMTGTVLYQNTSNYWTYSDKEQLVYVIPD